MGTEKLSISCNGTRNRDSRFCVVQLVVEKDGRLSIVEVLNSPDKLLTDEALRVIKKSPKFTPGKQRGVPVRVQFVLPVTFKL